MYTTNERPVLDGRTDGQTYILIVANAALNYVERPGPTLATLANCLLYLEALLEYVIVFCC